MNYWQIAKLFRSILSSSARVDPREIEDMGLLAVKIAQMYATRGDLLSEAKCRELSRLLHRSTPLPWSAFLARLHSVAPAGFFEQIAEISQTPLAAASLGQVHRARLKNGAEVVVKLTKADFRAPFLADVAKLRSLLKTSLFFYPPLARLADPLAALAAVEHTTLQEMDLLSEPRGAEQMQAIQQNDLETFPHLSRLRFPAYYHEISNSDVLVSEFLPHPTVAQRLAEGTMPYEALVELFRIQGHYLFLRGAFHGDLHPGNVTWTPESGFCFLDNGNVATVDLPFAQGLLRMLLQLGLGDFSTAARSLREVSHVPLSLEKSREFDRQFLEIYRDFAGKSVSQISLTQQMMRTVKLGVHCGVIFPGGVFPLIKCLMALDGMVIQAAPHAKLLEDVAQFASDFDLIQPAQRAAAVA